MCLELKDKFSEPLVATKAIRCYKAVYASNYVLRTPYMNSLIVFNRLLTARLSFSAKGDIERGYHVFTTKIQAQKFCDENRGCLVIPALLPVGSRYYEGRFQDFDSLTSDQIIYYSKWWVMRFFQGYYFPCLFFNH